MPKKNNEAERNKYSTACRSLLSMTHVKLRMTLGGEACKQPDGLQKSRLVRVPAVIYRWRSLPKVAVLHILLCTTNFNGFSFGGQKHSTTYTHYLQLQRLNTFCEISRLVIFSCQQRVLPCQRRGPVFRGSHFLWHDSPIFLKKRKKNSFVR